jgi:hypothetical protein
MALDHERFEIYQAALELFDLIDEIVEQLPRGRGHLADQLSRAGLSIVSQTRSKPGIFIPMSARKAGTGTGTGTESPPRKPNKKPYREYFTM